MTNSTKWMLGLVILMLAVSIFVIWNIQDRYFETEELTIQEAASQIETLYSGKVESFEQKGDIFYLLLDRNDSIYEIHIDSETGNIISFSKADIDTPDALDIKTEEEIRTLLTSENKGTIQKIKLYQNGLTPQYLVELTKDGALKTLVVHAKTGKIISEKTKEQTPIKPTVTAISSEKAKQISLAQLNGNVQYVTFEQSNDGGYYLVEVSTAEQRAVFEIHAITGKVISVTRHHYSQDDEDDDQSDDENDDKLDDGEEEDDEE